MAEMPEGTKEKREFLRRNFIQTIMGYESVSLESAKELLEGKSGVEDQKPLKEILGKMSAEQKGAVLDLVSNSISVFVHGFLLAMDGEAPQSLGKYSRYFRLEAELYLNGGGPGNNHPAERHHLNRYEDQELYRLYHEVSQSDV